VRRILSLLIVGLLFVPGLAQAGGKAKGPAKSDKAEACGEFGTSMHFEKNPSDAARRAQKEEKLVMVLHISGYFEDPDFT